MTTRQQRRAEERKARKLAMRSDASRLPVALPPPPSASAAPKPPVPSACTYSQIAESSTLAALLPDDQAAMYRSHLLAFLQQHEPAPGVETEIVKRMADSRWRLARITSLEAAIMALGRRTRADEVTETDPILRLALLDAQTLAIDGLVLKRLHTQETRLRRYYSSDLAELTAMQAQRKSVAAGVPESSSPADIVESLSAELALPGENGFVFSNGSCSEAEADQTTSLSLLSILTSGFADDLEDAELAATQAL